MSSSPEPPPPARRKSVREKKQVQIFSSDPNATRKRKRVEAQSGTDDEDRDERSDGLENEEIPSSSSEHDDDQEPEYVAPRRLPNAPSRRPKGAANAISASAAGDGDPPTTKPPPTKKARVAKGAPKAPKPPKGSRKGKGKAVDVDTGALSKASAISDDNTLFNAILNPSAALQSTAEDFLESYTDSKGVALADLVNCVLRACGCNSSVDSDQVLDSDGVVDALDDLMEEVKKELNPPYPLTSKLPVFRKFRRSLSELLYRIVLAAAETGGLYDSEFIFTIQTWVIAMSSSQVRSFRHTATVVGLEVESALAEVASAVDKEAELIRRQREGEKKKKNAAGSTAEKAKLSNREKDLQDKYDDVQKRRSKLKEFLRDFFDGLFVLRYRDADPGIRAECVQEFGVWLEKYPTFFLEGSHLRYLGWVLSDVNTQVRLAAVRSLAALYKRQDYLVSANHFTQRFKPRLVSMATSDTEVSVRVAVIQILCALDTLGELEEDQTNSLSLLVFDSEPKVRKAVSGFVKGVWTASVDDRLVGRRSGKDKDKDRGKVGLKCLASLLVKWAKALEKDADGTAALDQTESQEGASDAGGGYKSKEVSALVSDLQRGRIALCVESLWDEIEVVSDWEAMLEHLLLDHSAEDDDASSPVASKRKKAASKNKKKTVPGSRDDGDGVDEIWRLGEPEEAVLVEVFVASLNKTLADAAADKKKGEAELAQTEITRVLIKALPRLFQKHQADERRIAEVLVIPQLMNLDLYLEMRMVTAYETLWDDITKQFLSHSSPIVLRNAVLAITHLIKTSSLSNTNNTKIAELEEELSSALRDVVNGRDDLEVATFSDDEIHSLGTFALRVEALFKSRDLSSWMEDDSNGKQASVWTILVAIVDRGRRGYADEELMVDHSLQVLMLYTAWKARELGPAPASAEFTEVLKAKRDALIQKLEECAFGVASRPCQGVKRSAFRCLLILYILFHANQNDQGDGSSIHLPGYTLPLELSEEMQFRYGGFIEAEIEQYADDLMEDAEKNAGSDGDDTVGAQSEDDSEDGRKKKRGKRGLERMKDMLEAVDDLASQAHLEREYVFTSLLSTFLSAIRAGVLHFRHSVVPLTYYGRLGAAVDQCLKVLVEQLREEGMYKGNGEMVAAVISDAIKESFIHFLEGRAPDEDHTFVLSKALSAALIIRGAQLSIIQRLESEHLITIHTTLLSWITKKLAEYEGNNNKKLRNSAIQFFRVLSNLAIGLSSSEASKIKLHMDTVFKGAKIEPSPTAKFWEPQRSYEKRLSGVMTKEKPVGTKTKRKSNAKVAGFATTDEEADADVDDYMNRPGRSSPSRPQVRQRRTRSSKAARDGEADEEEQPEANVSKPRPKPRPKQKQAPKSAPEVAPTQDSDPIVTTQDNEMPSINGNQASPLPASSPEAAASQSPITNGVSKQSPRHSSPKKRPRHDEMEEDAQDSVRLGIDEDPIEDDDDDDDDDGMLVGKTNSKPPSQISQMSQLDIDFFRTRKRVRR